MNRRALALLISPLTVLVIAALLAASPDEPAPLFPADLRRIADGAAPEVAAMLRGLATPTDDLILADGTRIRVDPLSEYFHPGKGTSPRTVHGVGPDRKPIEIAGAEITEVRFYERQVLDAVAHLLKAEDPKQGAWAAEKALRAALRFSRSRREAPAGGPDPWAALQDGLSERLHDVRRALLQQLGQGEDLTEALHWADVWLPLYAPESRLGDDVRALWVRHAQRLVQAAGTPAAAIPWLERIDTTFAHSPQADPLRDALRGRAAAMLRESKELPDGKATTLLEQALALWPRLPGLRDELAKRRQRFQVLYVAVRDLPELFSPALAWSDAERQAIELIFEGLVRAHHDPKLGPHYEPDLVERLVTGSGTRRPLTLRRDVYWPDGERLTAADVRHTVQLVTQTGHAGAVPWREFLEPPRLEGNPFSIGIAYRQGLLDPWAPLGFKVLPQRAHGKALARADDLEFARQPIGTGPYQVVGKEGSAGRVYLVLRANPQYVRHGVAGPGSIREIRFFAWRDGDLAQPLPHLVLDVLPSQLAALKKRPFTDLRSLAVPRTWFLGLNHRRPALAQSDVRRALAHAIDRHGLLERHFRGGIPGITAQTVNGLFPRDSWANSPAQRVPEELYRPEDARASARKTAKALTGQEWTLKYPEGDPRLDAAFKELAEQVRKTLAGAEVNVIIRPVPLSPRKLQNAVRTRDFDLVYHYADLPTSPETLWALFDPHPEALAAGGTNFLGYEHDAPLQSLLRSAIHHRDFSEVRNFLQDVHARLYATMPLVPLWQLSYPVAVHPDLQVPDLDALAIFADVTQWKL